MASGRKKIKLFLGGLIVVALVSVMVVFMGYNSVATNPEALIDLIPDGANVSLGKINHTGTRDGKKEWVLTADSAQFVEEQNRAKLMNISVVFFLKQGGEVTMTAEKGWLNTVSNDMEVSGNIVILKDDYRLETEYLRYLHEKKLITTQKAVRISGDGFKIKSDSMRVELKGNKATLIGNVEGVIDGKLSI